MIFIGILLYLLIGVFIFGFGNDSKSEKEEAEVWLITMIIFAVVWPFALAYGIGQAMRHKHEENS